MSLFRELKRRNVFRVAAAYVVASWLLLQIVDVVVPLLALPEWVGRLVLLLLAVGLPIALILAWAFELTPEGIKKESEVDRSQSITPKTGRKLDFVIIAVLSVALAWFAWDKFVRGPADADRETVEDTATGESRLEISDKSVAVLPFVAMSSGPDDGYFADGLTEEILNSLAQLPELLVTARTSAFSFKGQELPVQEIAGALGVAHVVEGSVRKSDDRLRVTAQLIRAEDGFHLWSETFDSTSEDAISVQESIAEKIAAALDVVLDEEKREAMRAAGLRDVEAFTAYQKGLELYADAHGTGDIVAILREANTYFDTVIERVPDYAPAYIDHSDVFVHILNEDLFEAGNEAVTDQDVASALSNAIVDYRKAGLLARTDALRHSAELDLAFLTGNWRGISGRVEKALASSGCTNSSNWLSTIVPLAGLSEAYYQFMLERLACSPREWIPWFNAARSALWAGRTEKALALAREGNQIASGGWLNVELVRALVANGLHDEAATFIENEVTDEATAFALEGMIHAHRGNVLEFEQALNNHIEAAGTYALWVVIMRAWAGQRDEVNRMVSRMDAHPFGSVGLVQIVHWCACGAPFDLEATSNFAENIREGKLPWPPTTVLQFPNKDW